MAYDAEVLDAARQPLLVLLHQPQQLAVADEVQHRLPRCVALGRHLEGAQHLVDALVVRQPPHVHKGHPPLGGLAHRGDRAQRVALRRAHLRAEVRRHAARAHDARARGEGAPLAAVRRVERLQVVEALVAVEEDVVEGA
eukprot:6197293-Prymnesium_polylepis.1